MRLVLLEKRTCFSRITFTAQYVNSMPAVKIIQKLHKNTLQSFPHLNECLRKCCSTADPMLKLYRPKMLKHTCKAKEKKLLVSV